MAITAAPTPSVISTSLLVVSAIFPALSLVSVVLRWISRQKVKSGWRSDDWVIIVTWLITFAMSIDIWAFVPHIGINHAKEPLRQSTVNSAKCVWSATLLLTVSLAVVKISVLLFYKRIFVTRRFTIAIWIAIALVSSWGIVTTILHAVQSDPISTVWTGFGTFRFNAVALSEARAGTSLALDIIILVLPAEKIWKLHLSSKKKASVALILGLGGFCCIAAAVRLSLVVQTITGGVASKDAGYIRISRTGRTVIWGIIEPNCSIIAACLPCYGPLFRGRAPESIVRSVRSVVSLASLGSNHSRNSQRTDRSKIYSHGQRSAAVPLNKNSNELNESEIELRDLAQSSTRKASHSQEGLEEDINGAYSAHPDPTAK